MAALMLAARASFLPNVSFAQYESGITLMGNDVLVIKDRTVEVNGDILIMNNATLILEGSMILLQQGGDYEFQVKLFNASAAGQPRLILRDSSTIYSTYGFLTVAEENGFISLENSYYDMPLSAWGFARFEVKLSRIVGLTINGFSTAFVKNSSLETLTVYDSGQIHVAYSQLGEVSAHGTSKVTLEDSMVTESISCYDTSTAVLDGTVCMELGAFSSSNVTLTDGSEVFSASLSSNAVTTIKYSGVHVLEVSANAKASLDTCQVVNMIVEDSAKVTAQATVFTSIDPFEMGEIIIFGSSYALFDDCVVEWPIMVSEEAFLDLRYTDIFAELAISCENVAAVTHNLKPGYFSSWNLKENLMISGGPCPDVKIREGTVSAWTFAFGGASNVTLLNCELYQTVALEQSSISILESVITSQTLFSLASAGTSSVSAQSSFIPILRTFEYSSVSLICCNLTSIDTYDFSRVFCIEVGPWEFDLSIFIAENSSVQIEKGNVYSLDVQDSGTAVVSDLTTELAYVFDSARLFAIDTKIGEMDIKFNSTDVTIMELVEGHYDHWNLQEAFQLVGSSLDITLTNVDIRHWRLLFEGNSTVWTVDSSIDEVLASDEAMLEIFDTTVGKLTVEDSGMLLARNITVKAYVSLRDNATCSIEYSKIIGEWISVSRDAQLILDNTNVTGYIENWGWNPQSVLLYDSIINQFQLYSDVTAANTTISAILFMDPAAKVLFCNYLAVSVIDANNAPISEATVTASWLNGTTAKTASTLPDGTETLMLPWKEVNGTTTTEYGEYVINVEKEPYHSASAQVFMNVSQGITLTLAPSSTLLSLTIQPPTVEIGKQVVLTATLADENETPIGNAEITFKLDNNAIETTTTNSNGIATLTFTPQTSGIHEIKAEYTGSSSYSSATKSGTITVQAGAEFPYLPTIAVTVIAIAAIIILIIYKRKILLR